MIMKKTCKICGANSESEYCFQHKPRKPLKATSTLEKMRYWQEEYRKTISKLDKAMTTWEVFYSIWDKRPHKSEISGELLGKEPLSVYFHHILPKEKYPEACLDEENIIILSLDEHSNVENDIYRYEEINKRREQLKIKYNIN